MALRVIMHIDMDAFFAAVEQRDNPSLIGKPVIVGADPKGGAGRGVVSTCSYEARKFGVHSAQPISIAYRKCPHAVFLRGNYEKYTAVSKEIRKIFYNFTPHVEPISIDEAFLDMTGCVHFYGTPLNAGKALKEAIYKQTKLRSSIGIAPVKMVAKIASDYSKPDGLLEIRPKDLLKFLHPLPVKRLWGVGPKAESSLLSFGIKTIGDLARFPQKELIKSFGDLGLHLHRLANAIDEREVEVSDDVKSVSHEHTFEEDVSDKEILEQTILALSEKVSRRLRQYGLKGKTISIKIRLKGFKTYTRAVTLDQRANLIDTIYAQAKDLFNEFFNPDQSIRLIGVRVSNFEEEYIKDSLFIDPKDEKREQVQSALEKIKDKFGEESIRRGG